jgi:epoxyqueuosine reductase
MTDSTPENITSFIRTRLLNSGFQETGFARARALEEHRESLLRWIAAFSADMEYMQKNIEKRLNPSLLVPGTKSVVVAALNYFPSFKQDSQLPQIAKYAYGRDYHKVIKKKLNSLLNVLNQEFGISGRAFVDSAPIMEKPWGEIAGVGWIGKNGCLISPRFGSYFVMGILLLDCELEYDKPAIMACGSCRKCLDMCPTGAIISPGVVDSTRCLSYLTIEKKDDELTEVEKLHNRIFGCDICQDVCPWNKKAKPTDEPDFTPRLQLLQLNQTEWLAFDEKAFFDKAAGSPIMRAGLKGMKRNARNL